MKGRPAVLASISSGIAALLIAVCIAWINACDGKASPHPEGLSVSDAPDSPASDGFPYVDWDYWTTVNPDIIAWVTVPGTRISQPVVRADADDPEYYLSHDVYRQFNPMGVPYLDSGCPNGLDSLNSVVFGHNWSGGRVFSELTGYADEDFAKAHSIILLQTPDRKQRLEVLFVEIAKGSDDSKVTEFQSRDDFGSWLLERYRASAVHLWKEGGIASLPESIVTFCTCSYAGPDDRTLVYAC